ncbi:MAG: sodium:proton antiporter [Allobaculum sp.]|nr:sodium:proton antiporter [Allobaculum sp.]
MFASLALLLLGGLALGYICKKIGLPALTGMIAAGLIFGYFGWLDPALMDISADLRKIALLIIISRAGFNLNLDQLKKAGLPALLMTFVPATFEIIGTMIFAPMILGLPLAQAALLGTVIGAVSPAIIVPRMIDLIQKGYGQKKAIPQMILAGASLDDIYVIVLFSIFLSMSLSGDFNASTLLDIPISIGLGLIVGILGGIGLGWFYSKVKVRPIIQTIQFYAIAFALTALETILEPYVSFSSLLAVMCLAIFLGRISPESAKEIGTRSDGLWSCAEIFLFVLVGAEVNIMDAFQSGLQGALLLGLALMVRMVGVLVALLPSNFSWKEKVFCMIAYTPKATVQAALGAVPLAAGVSGGQIILTVAVLSILLCAPLGGWAIDATYKKLLLKD